MSENGVDQIVSELCSSLDEQMSVVSGRGLQGLTEEELAGYERRRARIATLRSELDNLVPPD
jgi:hypothetical protein